MRYQQGGHSQSLVVFRQQRARWTAKLARVRLSSRAPWEQERRIVGMVASPGENLSIVLLKLDRPVQLSDFVRSVCLSGVVEEGSRCLGLGWDSQEGQLTVTPLTTASSSHCQSNTDLTSSVCMEEIPGTEDCGGEMMAGHGLVCEVSPGSDQWTLLGVSAWRRGCGSVGQRPRMYELVTATADWVESVLAKDQQKTPLPRRRFG